MKLTCTHSLLPPTFEKNGFGNFTASQGTNFRKAYYSSLGVKAVEVKPSVENALQGDVLSIDRLNRLCLWVRIPHYYRPLVWKILLGVLPVYREAWEFVSQQRKQHYTALREAVALLCGTSSQRTRTSGYGRDDANDDDHDDTGRQRQESDNDEHDPVTLSRMVLLETADASPKKIAEILAEEPPKHLVMLAAAFAEICDASPEDAFWLLLHFVKTFHIHLPPSCMSGVQPDTVTAWNNTGIDNMTNLLGLHNPNLLSHLQSLGVPLHDVCNEWFQCFFSNIISSHAIEGVWDILIGGAPTIVPYVGLSLLLAARRKIEAARSAAEITDIFNKLDKFVDVNAVANMSIDLWEKPVLEGMPKEMRKMLGY